MTCPSWVCFPCSFVKDVKSCWLGLIYLTTLRLFKQKVPNIYLEFCFRWVVVYYSIILLLDSSLVRERRVMLKDGSGLKDLIRTGHEVAPRRQSGNVIHGNRPLQQLLFEPSCEKSHQKCRIFVGTPFWICVCSSVQVQVDEIWGGSLFPVNYLVLAFLKTLTMWGRHTNETQWTMCFDEADHVDPCLNQHTTLL